MSIVLPIFDSAACFWEVDQDWQSFVRAGRLGIIPFLVYRGKPRPARALRNVRGLTTFLIPAVTVEVIASSKKAQPERLRGIPILVYSDYMEPKLS